MLRLANLEPDPEDDEQSVTVADAARRLGCAQSTVRDLLDCGELTGHKVGKTAKPGGVRVHLESIRHYKRRNAIGGKPAPGRPAPRVSHNAAAAEATKPARNKKEAREVEGVARSAARGAEKAGRSIARPGTFPFGRAMVLHIEHQVGSSPVHVANIKAYARELLEHFGNDTPIAEITQGQVDDYRRIAAAMPVKVWRGGPNKRAKAPAKMGTGSRIRSPASVNHRLNCLRAVLAQAHRIKDPVTGLSMLPFPPVVTPVPEPKRRPRPMLDGELRARLAGAPSWVVDAAELARYFGLRRAEALQVELRHIDREHQALRFDGDQTKSGRDEFAHALPGGWPVLSRLARQARRRGQVRLVTWPGPEHVVDYLTGRKVPRDAWRPLKSIRRAWRATADKAGVAHPGRLHDVRARYISEVAKVASSATTQEVARHADPKTTARYVDITPEEVRRALRRVPRPVKPALRVISRK